jgi:BMFP domain-containing protein YqiC
MNKNNKILDEILDNTAKLFGDGLASIGNIKNEIDSIIKNKMENYLNEMDLVTRREYEILLDMVSVIKEEQEKLKKQLKQKK